MDMKMELEREEGKREKRRRPQLRHYHVNTALQFSPFNSETPILLFLFNLLIVFVIKNKMKMVKTKSKSMFGLSLSPCLLWTVECCVLLLSTFFWLRVKFC